MFDHLWTHLHKIFRINAVRSLRLTLIAHDKLYTYPTFTDKQCDDWENMYLMGGEL